MKNLTWIGGQPLGTYTYWDDDQMNKTDGCVHYMPQTNKWGFEKCGIRKCSICEKTGKLPFHTLQGDHGSRVCLGLFCFVEGFLLE